METQTDNISFTHFQFEMFGTFLFVYIILWSRMAVEAFNMDYMETAIVTGMIFSVLATLAMKTSGGHYNPAITMSLVLCDKMTVWKGMSYILAHMIGSVLASALIAFTASERLLDLARETSVYGMPRVREEYGFSQVSAFISEALGSGFIMSMYWSSTLDKTISSQLKGYLTGVSVTISTMCFYNVSGACFNPMLIFGPCMVSRTLRIYHWLYYFGPIIGMLGVSLALGKMERLKEAANSKKSSKKKKDLGYDVPELEEDENPAPQGPTTTDTEIDEGVPEGERPDPIPKNPDGEGGNN